MRKGLSRMNPSVLGLDGWSPADLRSLSDKLLGWLADLVREVECLGKWPARLPEGYTALIPKEGPPGPLNTRPLTAHRLHGGATPPPAPPAAKPPASLRDVFSRISAALSSHTLPRRRSPPRGRRRP